MVRGACAFISILSSSAEEIKLMNLIRTTVSTVLLVCGSWALALDNTSEWPVTDFENSSVDHKEIMSGGPPKDGIPAIDQPKFIDPSEASEWLQNKEPVIAIKIGNEARAYPLQILMWHEIVNDIIGDKAVSVTFCPLCNASIVFDRDLDGVRYDFGTTGRLRLSDMVMYDRQTESWWQQFTGQAIIGDLNGDKLKIIPSNIVAFESFKKQYPKGLVLSRETGHRRNYGRNPYAGYDDINSSPFLFRGKVDKRIRPMERVLSLRSNDKTLLFELTALQEKPVINSEFEGTSFVVLAFEDMNSALDKSEIKSSRLIPSASVYSAMVDNKKLTFQFEDGVVTDRETGTSWNIFGIAEQGELAGQQLQQLDHGVHFAFAWLAFDPEAEIFKH